MTPSILSNLTPTTLSAIVAEIEDAVEKGSLARDMTTLDLLVAVRCELLANCGPEDAAVYIDAHKENL